MMKKIDINYIHLTWEDVEKNCYSLYDAMCESDYRPDCIIGLSRGGIIPARILSDCFNIKKDLHIMSVESYSGVNKRKDKTTIKPFDIFLGRKKVLIVDDIFDSGKTIKDVLNYLKINNSNRYTDISVVTLYCKLNASNKPNWYSQIAYDNEWIVFPWEKFEFAWEVKKG